GNCGFGIAPCPPAMRTLMAQNLSVVEGMNLDALLNGIEWRFESFGEYLDFLRTRKTVPNVAAFVGHTPVRTAVMGAAGSESAPGSAWPNARKRRRAAPRSTARSRASR